jgi:hypothetical protein
MTRYTNVGWKRTYHQANFDPDDNQSARNTASTSVLSSSDAAATFHASYKSGIDIPLEAEPNRKGRRKSKADSERKVEADSAPVAIASNKDNTTSSVTKNTKTKKGLTAKLKTRRAKSA